MVTFLHATLRNSFEREPASRGIAGMVENSRSLRHGEEEKGAKERVGGVGC